MAEKSGSQAGLSANDQYRLALLKIVEQGGKATMQEIYAAVEARMSPDTLSDVGKATLRNYVNKVLVQAGFVSKGDGSWVITAEGREFLGLAELTKVTEVVTEGSGTEIIVPSVAVRAIAFEKYVLSLMRQVYPEYSWYHQGMHKQNERGVDLLGTRLRPDPGHPEVIGVQVKCHAADNAPSIVEWLKFLAGCFARKVDRGLFVTTGRLTGDQRREAAEARVAVIEGKGELDRIAIQHGMDPFPDYGEVDSESPAKSKNSAYKQTGG
jgi:hypothetical protein